MKSMHMRHTARVLQNKDHVDEPSRVFHFTDKVYIFKLFYLFHSLIPFVVVSSSLLLDLSVGKINTKSVRDEGEINPGHVIVRLSKHLRTLIEKGN